jgi:hypothetical protein
MALYYGRHKVRDYNEWRPLFDADQERMTNIGTKIVSVTRSTEDANDVHLIFDISDMAAFVAELQNPAMGEVMAKAGVLEQPVMYALTELKS